MAPTMIIGNQIPIQQRSEGEAMVLAIGTANPPNVFYQTDYPDYYFRITKSEHLTELKNKFRRICEKSMVRKRHMYMTEEILNQYPNICSYMEPSLTDRRQIDTVEIPKLAKEACLRAIQEWGQPKSEITHLIFATTGSTDMPGADYQLTKILQLSPSVKRFMSYQLGCFAGATILRLAKDIAENNRGARILVVCAEINVVTFRGPSESHIDDLVGRALFADGAGAVIVGSDPRLSIEKPLFQIVSTSQTILPDSEGTIGGHIGEGGLTLHLLSSVPTMIADNIENSLTEAFGPLGISDWNSLFWIAHPGGPAILNHIQKKLGLKDDKLKATRHVLQEYGNMSGACVLFTMDEMRRKSAEDGKCTTGEGLNWGVLFGFGPGLTVETIVLRSFPINY